MGTGKNNLLSICLVVLNQEWSRHTFAAKRLWFIGEKSWTMSDGGVLFNYIIVINRHTHIYNHIYIYLYIYIHAMRLKLQKKWDASTMKSD